MSVSKKFWTLIKSDYERYRQLGARLSVNNITIGLIINALTCKNHCIAFLFWMRLLSCRPAFPIRIISKIMYHRLYRKYGLQIPYNTSIGSGFYIGHGIGIVINGKTKIGKNCNVSQFLTIGSTKGTPATIGDNVYIGPGVCIVEDVKIGNNVKIGAGTVVIHDVPDGATTVGNPNRIIIK